MSDYTATRKAPPPPQRTNVLEAEYSDKYHEAMLAWAKAWWGCFTKKNPGLSIRDQAEKAGVSPSTIQVYRNKYS